MKRRSWFLPESADVLGMLREQARVTVDGVAALVAWAAGDPAGADGVRACEHRADDRKRELRRALTEAYTTPIDAEDIYTMSARLDGVMNGVKGTADNLRAAIAGEGSMNDSMPTIPS